METIIKLDQATIQDLAKTYLENNQILINTIINELNKINNDNMINMIKIYEDKKKKNDKLYTKTELSKILNISTRTLQKKSIPYKTIENGSRKYYSLDEVKEYLNR